MSLVSVLSDSQRKGRKSSKWDSHPYQLTFWHDDNPRTCGKYGWSEARSKGVARLAPPYIDELTNEPQLSALYEQLNTHYFGATLPPVPVRRGLLATARRSADVLAHCVTVDEVGTGPTAVISIHIAESLFSVAPTEGGDRWSEIVRCMLHEMVHVAVELDWLGGRYADEIDPHGREFANECNRIGRTEGWDHVVASRRAVADSEDAKWWPLDGTCETCAVVGTRRQSAYCEEPSVTLARS